MTEAPDHFFIVGAQRCGTTYLCHLLDEHPAIEMARPFRPEPKHFLRDVSVAHGPSHYESSFFGKKPGALLRGEKSTSYMESPSAAKRISDWFPLARIVFVLRNPIERAISHYWFSVKNGLETLTMAEAFRREEERRHSFDPGQVSVSPFAYLSRGLYTNAIAMYEDFFPRENIAVLIYEEMVATIAPVQQLYSFLGVDPRFLPAATGRRINEGGYDSHDLPSELAEYVEGYFKESTARLAARTGRDLSMLWKPGTSSTRPASAASSSTAA